MSESELKNKILIVDDEARVGQSLETLTRAMGLHPRVVHSGYDAQKLLVIEAFDAMITDLVMPGVSGFDLIEFVQHRGLRMPIIVLTGEGTVQAAVQALKQGAYDFVVKPFEPERFRTMIVHALEKSALERKRLEQAQLTEQLQAEIRQSKQYLELVLQSAEDVAIITTNRQGRVKTYNTGAEKMVGAPLEQVLGQPIDLCFSNPKVAKITQEFLEARRLEPWREELPIKNHHGSQRWVHLVMRWMESASASLAGLIVVATDVTQRHLLREKLKILTITDDLTSLYNQRYFYEALRREIERSNRRNTPFVLVLFDIDRFKHYNDEFGHLKGDEILREVGTIVQSTIRKIDFGFRYGGDEFALLLPETEMENAASIAERLRAQVEQHFHGRVTVSIGLAQGGSNTEERLLIEGADSALYESKRLGGNSVSHSTKSPTPVKQ